MREVWSIFASCAVSPRFKSCKSSNTVTFICRACLKVLDDKRWLGTDGMVEIPFPFMWTVDGIFSFWRFQVDLVQNVSIIRCRSSFFCSAVESFLYLTITEAATTPSNASFITLPTYIMRTSTASTLIGPLAAVCVQAVPQYVDETYTYNGPDVKSEVGSIRQ